MKTEYDLLPSNMNNHHVDDKAMNESDVSDFVELEAGPAAAPKPAPKKKMFQQKNKDPEVLSSTHLVFFKISDYIDFEPPSAQGIRNRFLVVFKNVECFCDFAIATIILMSQIVVMGNIFHESKHDCVENGYLKNLWMGGILCSLYAASVSTEALLLALPYEIIGTTPEGAEQLIHLVEESKRKKTDLFSDANSRLSDAGDDAHNTNPIHHHDTQVVPEVQPAEEAKGTISLNDVPPDSYTEFDLRVVRQVSATAVSYVYLWAVAVFLQLSNVLLLLVVGSVMGSATSFTDLVSRFISVEIVIHVHEIVPRILKIRDKSPKRYNKSGIDLEQELESSGRLPYGMIVPPGPDGKGGVYRSSAKFHKNLIFWAIFAFVYGIFLIMLYACQDKEKFGL